MLQGDAGDEGGEPARLFTLVPLVSQIDVVDDVRDVAQRRVVGSPAGEQHLERAHLALVRKLGVEHVEAELAGGWNVSLGLDIFELRVGVDEPSNQPGARDPIDVNALAGDPGAAANAAQRR